MVYHYTTLETFYNILASYKESEDKEYLTFWASNALNQNDLSELSLRVKDIIAVVQDIEKDMSLTIKKMSTVINEDWIPSLTGYKIKESFDDMLRNAKYSPYTVSFSKKEDSLLMWSMYGNNGTGVCLAFDPQKLIWPQSQLQYIADTVIYDKEPIYYRNVIEQYYDIYRKEVEYDNLLQSIYVKKQEFFVSMLWHIAPFIKNKAFKDEAEYRIAYYATNDGVTPIYTRLTNRLNVINFIKVNIPLESLKHIIIGPCADYRRVKKLLVENMKSCHIDRNYNKGFISKSQVPYRIY